MKRTIIILALLFVLSIPNSSATTTTLITNATFGAACAPNFVMYSFFPNELDVSGSPACLENIYLGLPVSDITQHSNYVLNLKVYAITANSTMTMYVSNTVSFNPTTLTWNTRPATGTLITSFTNHGTGFYTVPLPSPGITSQYLVIWSNTSATTVLFFCNFHGRDSQCNDGRPSITYSDTSFTASGHVYFTDIDNTTSPLPGATVRYNSTIYSTTDSNGAWSIQGLPNGAYSLTASKSPAFNTATGTVSNVTPTRDFTLLYSRADLSTPAFSGGRIYTTYTPNFGSVNLWEKPNYVWAEIKYDKFIGTPNDKWYFIQARSEGSGRFSISEEPGKGNYQVFFTSSDIYNNPTNPWHPTLSVNRSFDSGIIYFQDPLDKNGTFNKSIATREIGIKTDFWLWFPFLAFLFLMIAFVSRLNEANRK